MSKKEKTSNVNFAKSGNGYYSVRITLPNEWVSDMGINKDNKNVKLTYDGKKIIIEKYGGFKNDMFKMWK